MNSRPLKPVVTPEPIKHVIEEYKHRDQTVTCVCGWHGSTATTPNGQTSEWNAHLVAMRGKKR